MGEGPNLSASLGEISTRMVTLAPFIRHTRPGAGEMRVFFWAFLLTVVVLMGLCGLLLALPSGLLETFPSPRGTTTPAPTTPRPGETPPATPSPAGEESLSDRTLEVLDSYVVAIEARREEPGQQPRSVIVRVSKGTGTIVRVVEDGYLILTASHVLEGDQITARRLGGRLPCDATVVSRLEREDLALLRCTFSQPGPLPELSPLSIVHDARGYEGRPAAFRCYFDDSYRQGEVLGRTVSTSGAPVLMIEAPVEPGCSGSGLLDARGNLIGVVVGRDVGAGTTGASIIPNGFPG